MALQKIKTAYCEYKEALCLAEGKSLDVAYMVIGDGNGTTPELYKNMTSLVNERCKLNVTMDKKNFPKYKFIADIPQDIEEFPITELGLVDKDNNLLYVSQMDGTMTNLLKSGISKQLRLQMQFTPANGVNIVIIDPTTIIPSVDFCDDTYQKISEKAQPNGYAPLDENCKIPVAVIPETYKRFQLGDPVATFSDDLPENAVWLEGAEVSRLDYSNLHEKYGDKFNILNFDDAGLVSTGINFNAHSNNTCYTFSSRNYLTLKEPFVPGEKPWEMVFKVTTGTTNAVQTLVGANNNNTYSAGLVLQKDANNLLQLFVSNNGTSWAINNTKGTKVFANGTEYYIKLEYTGSAYKVSWSDDGIDYTEDISVENSSAIYQPATSTLSFGNHLSSSSTQYPWLGTIDFKYTTIRPKSENSENGYDEDVWTWNKKFDDANTFRLPNLVDRTLWGTTSFDFGYISAGLPNIVGYANIVGLRADKGGSASGAFTISNNGNSKGEGSDSQKYSLNLNFNASRSNSIYGGSITVQTPSIKTRFYTYYK